MIKRALLTGMLGLLAAVAAPVSPASAQPLLVIESPASGSATNHVRPVFSGSTTDVEDAVTVTVFSGGSFVESATATPEPGGGWSVQLPKELADGKYSAIAEQTEELSGETGSSGAVSFRVDTLPPTVTLDSVSSPTNDPAPSFTGTASDTEQVTVDIFKGSSAGGTIVAEAHASGTGGSWASDSASPALADGTYTALAEQESSLGNGPGFSQERTFVVHTAKPVVSLNAVSSPTNDSTPSFSGTASEKTAVTVSVFAAGDVGGTVLAKVTASGTGGSWSSGGASPPLADGTYTAIAEQESSFGNGPGVSQERTFTVHTAKPVVTLNAVSSPTADSTPSFSGTASETTGVTIFIFSGDSASGSPVAKATATPTGGSWTSGGASPALADGTYTALAEQESSLGNGPGFSQERTFVVHTAKPVVSLNAVSSPTNDSTPSFSGTASEKTAVTVSVFAAGDVGGTVLAKVTASGTGGSWSSGGASPPLADGTYTAIAEQESSFGNGPGVSQERTFTVHTAKPVVTLNAVSSPTADSTPSFSGTASEKSAVTVLIYKGASASGSPVASATASGAGGSWSSGGASPALADGTYTAVAEQESSFGDGPGFSQERTFTVDTKPPTVTLNAIDALSNDTTPSFTGTASDTEPVTIHILKNGSTYTTATATGTGGAWSSGGPAIALVEGSYSAFATQESSHGSGTGKSTEIHFAVVTAAPKVTLNAIAESGNTQPSFSGTASDESEPVTILIYKGPKAEGAPVSSAGAIGNGGSWSSGQASPALEGGVHEYTAVAEQNSSLGNPTGASKEVHFIVDTRSPVVTLNAVATPSKNATPTFSGTASDRTPVVVHVFDAAEHEVASAEGTPSGGSWAAGISKALVSGGYTAVAVQSSSLGNPAGHSEIVSFTVNTQPPTVTLAAPQGRSNNTSPSFSGTATDTTAVTVSVYAGTSATGTPVATATAAGTGGAWVSGAVSTPLVTGTYTARAVQKSSLGNPDGVSETRTFEVDTRAPTVTLEQPPARSKNTTPSFSGTATGAEKVVVSVYKGTSASGTAVATASAEGTRAAWASGAVSKALEPGTYTAKAVQKSSIGNPDGESEPRTFVIDTSAPKVTLEAIAALSNTASPVFKGTASDSTAVTVSVYKGPTATGTVVATAEGAPAAGTFTTAAAAPALPSGSYTAVARQPSSIENPTGESGPVKFEVNTEAPAVTIEALPARSNKRTPAFSGTVSGKEAKFETVTVHVFDAAEHEVATATATPSGGKWTATNVTPALAEGSNAYSAYATEPSSLGNAAGKSATIAFTIDTNPPTVTLEQIATPSNNTAPTFTGTASDGGPVTLEILGGRSPIKVTAPVAEGKWTAGPVTLPSAEAEYVATASQASSIGNPTGKSKPIRFFVDPRAPSMFMAALAPPKGQVGTPTPTFTGTASGTAPVTVAICKLTTPCAAEQGEWTAHSAGGGAWSATLATPLPDGRYQAFASQRSATGALGATEAEKFTIDTVPPALTMTAPAQGATVVGSSLEVRGAAGTAEFDEGEVTVELFAGASIAPSQSPVQAPVKVRASGGAWSAQLGGIAPGSYTVRASQLDAAGNIGTALRSFVVATPAPAASGPAAAFNWFPSHPHVGETVTLVSTSTDSASPITGYSWNLLGSAFASGAQKQTTSFATAGAHPVSLRVTDSAGLSSSISQQVPVSLPLMRPFPVVRIVSTRSAKRVHVKLLRIEAPPGVTVTVTCRGKGCPLRTLSKLVARPKGKASGTPSLTFPRAQRSFPAGVALEVRIAAAGEVGKYTRFAIRRGKLPIRSDACLNAREPRPVPCSS